jgi:hypothetical protein
MRCAETLPTKIRWRVFLELADLAKREHELDDARALYQKVNALEPHAKEGWLEWAKMEEVRRREGGEICERESWERMHVHHVVCRVQ